MELGTQLLIDVVAVKNAFIVTLHFEEKYTYKYLHAEHD